MRIPLLRPRAAGGHYRNDVNSAAGISRSDLHLYIIQYRSPCFQHFPSTLFDTDQTFAEINQSPSITYRY